MRAALLGLEASRIREVANAGMGRADVLAFWFGEPDVVTPAFIRDAAKAALDAGDTFYTQNLGIPPLREAIADYLGGMHGSFAADRVAVTNSGVSALMLIAQALFDPGARVVIVTPVWPNLTQIPAILSAEVVRVPQTFDKGTWTLDTNRLLDAITPGTAAVVINSPSNPTGWTISRAQQEAVLEKCRRLGVWIVSDDAYERLVYGDDAAGIAPSFFDIAAPDDRLVSANTFSKAWAMTGWRLGWVAGPAGFVEQLGKLIEYNTSCAPGFIQSAAMVALRDGEAAMSAMRGRYRGLRDQLVSELRALPGIEAGFPDGAMYAFFRVAGMTDSLAFAKQLVAGHGLGLAPGAAFGPEGEGFLRWCFASTPERLREGVRRLRLALR